VNKKTILAFILILATIVSFQTYENMRSGKKSKEVSSLQSTAKVRTGENEKGGFKESEKAIEMSIKNSVPLVPDTSIKIEPIDTIWIENEKIVCGISEDGAKIISLRMKDFGYNRIKPNLADPKEQVDLVANSTAGGANLQVDGLDLDNKRFFFNGNNKILKIAGSDSISISFTSKLANGEDVQKLYTFSGNSYKIGMGISSLNLVGKTLIVGWKCGITESEVYSDQPGQNHQSSYINEQRKAHLFDGKGIEHIQLKKPEKKEETGSYRWSAITSKYFMVALVPDSIKDADFLIEGYDAKANDDNAVENKKVKNIDYSLSIKKTADKQCETYWIFAGPSKLSLIKSFKNSFEKVLFNGWDWFFWASTWFPLICEGTLWLVVYINTMTHDYGITIILITILIRLVTFPMSQSSMKSMNRMKLLQPRINSIRERYKKNPKKMNEEIMAVYKENGVNPMNPGCLPMFLQMPILFALFVVLQKAIELRGAHTFLIPWVKDLSQPEILVSLKQMHLDGMFPNGIPMYGYGIALLPIVMSILTYFQNKMTITDPNQKAMIYMMPVFMLVIFNNFPAGLVLYWTFSNGLGIIQQYYLNKKMKTDMVSVQTVENKQVTGKKGK
jgi:YidC/Oxa1 family membrane protein insertase